MIYASLRNMIWMLTIFAATLGAINSICATIAPRCMLISFLDIPCSFGRHKQNINVHSVIVHFHVKGVFWSDEVFSSRYFGIFLQRTHQLLLLFSLLIHAY